MEYIYWNGKGAYSQTLDRLWEGIPAKGSVSEKGRRLEKLRQMVQVYYDLYNNGLANCFAEVRTAVGVTPKHYGLHRWSGIDCLRNDAFLSAIERHIDDAILDAADEQGIEIVELSAHARIARAAVRD